MTRTQHFAHPEMTPEQIMQIGMSFMPARCMASALQLGVFDAIASGNKDAGAIAMHAGATPRGIRMLLDALTALGLIRKSHDHYSLTPATQQYLVKSSPDYMGGVTETDSLWNAWGHLTEAIKHDKPWQSVNEQKQAEAFFPILIRGLHVANREPARKTAEALGVGGTLKGAHVLDVACGSGVWGIACAEADPTARVTYQDFPPVLETAHEYVKKHGVESRAELLAGDLNTTDFGEKKFDIALLGNIVHSEGEISSRKLFKNLHRAMKHGGRIAIIDMIPNEERSGPPFPILFAINMLVNTRVGDCYTLSEYTAWLNEAGFDDVKTHDIGSHSPLITALRV